MWRRYGKVYRRRRKVYRRRSIEEQAFGPTEASPISGLRSNLPAMGFSRALQSPEETTNNDIALLGGPFTILAQKHFGVVTTLHCSGSHSHCSTMIKPKDNPLQLCCLWQLCEDECCTISTLKLLPAYIVSYHSDYNEPQTSNVMERGLKQFCGTAAKVILLRGERGREACLILKDVLFGGFKKRTVEF